MTKEKNLVIEVTRATIFSNGLELQPKYKIFIYADRV